MMLNLFKKTFKSKEPDEQREEFCCVYDAPDIIKPSESLEAKLNSVIIGRHPDCDIIIKDYRISRKHCQIKYHAESDTYTIRDLSSTNGTYVNDVRIGLDWAALSIGDTLRLGTLAFSFEKECSELRVLRYEKTINL